MLGNNHTNSRGAEGDAGHYRGRHFSEWTDDVTSLKRAGRLDEAADLLWHLVAATENDAAVNRWGVAPWYYEQLAIIARKRGDVAGEVAVLERYEQQRKAPGAGPSKLASRLAQTRRRLTQHKAAAGGVTCPSCGAQATAGRSGVCTACGSRFVLPTS